MSIVRTNHVFSHLKKFQPLRRAFSLEFRPEELIDYTVDPLDETVNI
jgi:hypothetical protein